MPLLQNPSITSMIHTAARYDESCLMGKPVFFKWSRPGRQAPLHEAATPF